MKKKIRFLCTKNSVRSQMAEGLMNHLRADQFEAYSAGVEPLWVHPCAIEVMKEMGIDISKQRSKHLDEFKQIPIDYMVSLCDNAAATCPVFEGGGRRIHHAFTNPADAVSVFRSLEHIYAQVIDDAAGRTLVSASTVDSEIRKQVEGKNKTEQAKIVGRYTSLEQARAWFERAVASAIAKTESLSDAELLEALPAGPIMGGAPRMAIFGAITDHTAHHRGALTVCDARLNGIVPPMPYMEM